MEGNYTFPINQSENNRLALMYADEEQNVMEMAATPVSSPNRAENEKIGTLFASIGQRNSGEGETLSLSNLAEIERVNAWAARFDKKNAETQAIIDSWRRERLAKKDIPQVDYKEPESAPKAHANIKQRQWMVIGGITGGVLIGTLAKIVSSMSFVGLMMSSLAGLLASGFVSYHLYSAMKTQN